MTHVHYDIDPIDYLPLSLFGVLFVFSVWRFFVHKAALFCCKPADAHRFSVKQGFHLFLMLFSVSVGATAAPTTAAAAPVHARPPVVQSARLGYAILLVIPRDTDLANVCLDTAGFCFNFTFLFFLEAHWRALLYPRNSKQSRRLWLVFLLFNVLFYAAMIVGTFHACVVTPHAARRNPARPPFWLPLTRAVPLSQPLHGSGKKATSW